LLARVALWLWLLGILVAFALAGGDFAIDLGLFALGHCVVASDVSFDAIDLCTGAIERIAHSRERRAATPQSGVRHAVVLLVEPLVALVCEPLTMVGEPLTLVGEPLTMVGEPLTMVGDTVSFIRATLSFI